MVTEAAWAVGLMLAPGCKFMSGRENNTTAPTESTDASVTVMVCVSSGCWYALTYSTSVCTSTPGANVTTPDAAWAVPLRKYRSAPAGAMLNATLIVSAEPMVRRMVKDTGVAAPGCLTTVCAMLAAWNANRPLTL